MEFLFEHNSFGGSGKRNKTLEDFKELKSFISSVPLGTIAGKYCEGAKDDMGRLTQDCYLELFYSVGRQLKEEMYRVRKTSVRQLEEIKNWIDEGKIRKGHVNLMKYQSNDRKIIVI